MKHHLLILAWLGGAGALVGQTGTASFAGTVTDPDDGVLPAAKVRMVGKGTGIELASQCAADGTFRFPSVIPGEFTVEIEAPGFAVKRITEFVMSASETVVWRIPLSYETPTFRVETVASSAAGVRVQNAEAQISRVITLKELETLPQIGRDPLQLALYSPGVLRSGEASRINGTRNGSTTTRQDGILTADPIRPRFGLTSTFTNLDSIAEVRLVLNGGKAEYGRTGGAQVELVSKGGTNRFSGNLFHYHRNTVLNANSFFNNSVGNARAKLIQNRFGGSLGGPVVRNRTFFHLNFQGSENASDVRRNRTVLTAEARAGVFRWRTPAGVLQSFDIARNDPRGLGIDAEVRRKLNLTPLPNNTNIGDGLNTAGYLFNNPANSSAPQGTARVDHTIDGSRRLFVRYSRANFESIGAFNGIDSPFPGQAPGRQFAPSSGVSVGFDWQIRPNVIHELRAGGTFYDVTFFVPREKGPVVVPSTFSNPDFSRATNRRQVPLWEINDSVSWIRSRHTVKGGVSWTRSMEHTMNETGIYPSIFTSRSFGNIPPASVGPSGAAIAPADRTRFESLYNDLLGRISSISQTFQSDLTKYLPAGTPQRRDYRWQDWGFFVQDDWKVLPRLHLNVGMRYELFQVPVERNGFMGGLDRPGAALGFAPVTDFTIRQVSRFLPSDRNNLAPRFGFAYDPTGSGKTAIRGSFGVFYERGIGALVESLNNNTPGFTFVGQSLPNAGGSGDVRLADRPAMPSAPAAVNPLFPVTRSTGIVAATEYLPRPYFLQWNFSVQREIGKSTVVEAAYVAMRGVKLGQMLMVNQKDLAGSGFLRDFVQLRTFQAGGAPVPAANSLVRMFGSPQAAINTLGASQFQLGAAGSVAETLDRSFFNRYAAAGLAQTYLRPFPQFSTLHAAEASGRSYFDSLQLSLRRDAGWLRTTVNYMFSKNIDTVPGDNGDGSDVPFDRFDLRRSRGLSIAHLPHSLNMTATVRLPFGWGRRFGKQMPRVLEALAGGWDVGVLGFAQSGKAFTVGSPVDQVGAASTVNYDGGRIGKVERLGNGVRYLTPEQMGLFSIPEPGAFGTLGKSFFQGPFYWNTDVSIVKRFAVTEAQSLMLRLEAYNVTNHVVFGTPNVNLLTPQTFGRFSGTTNSPRNLQIALRYSF